MASTRGAVTLSGGSDPLQATISHTVVPEERCIEVVVTVYNATNAKLEEFGVALLRGGGASGGESVTAAAGSPPFRVASTEPLQPGAAIVWRWSLVPESFGPLTVAAELWFAGLEVEGDADSDSDEDPDPDSSANRRSSTGMLLRPTTFGRSSPGGLSPGTPKISEEGEDEEGDGGGGDGLGGGEGMGDGGGGDGGGGGPLMSQPTVLPATPYKMQATSLLLPAVSCHRTAAAFQSMWGRLVYVGGGQRFRQAAPHTLTKDSGLS